MSRQYLLIFTATLFYAGHAFSQPIGDYEQSRYGSASYYNYAEAADVTMLVNVWGTVRNPGLYEIPQTTTLSRLLSLSGGPIVSQRSQRQDRLILVRLYRMEVSGRKLFYRSEMENEVVVTADDPILIDGDVVTIETVVRQRFEWRDVFPIVAAVGTVVIALERIISSR